MSLWAQLVKNFGGRFIHEALGGGPATGAARQRENELTREAVNDTTVETAHDAHVRTACARREVLTTTNDSSAEERRTLDEEESRHNKIMQCLSDMIEMHNRMRAISEQRAAAVERLARVLKEMDDIWQEWLDRAEEHGRTAVAKRASIEQMRRAFTRLAALDTGDAQSTSSRQCGELVLASFEALVQPGGVCHSDVDDSWTHIGFYALRAAVPIRPLRMHDFWWCCVGCRSPI